MTHVTVLVNPGRTLADAARAEHKRSPDLQVLRGLLGGYIETVPHLTSFELDGWRVRCLAYADEEGRLKRLPRNDAASIIWRDELLRQNPGATFRYEPELFGPVVFVVNSNQLKNRFHAKVKV